MTGHSSAKTAGLYDRRNDDINLDKWSAFASDFSDIQARVFAFSLGAVCKPIVLKQVE